jgi:hypothetical protein
MDAISSRTRWSSASCVTWDRTRPPPPLGVSVGMYVCVALAVYLCVDVGGRTCTRSVPTNFSDEFSQKCGSE